MAGQTTRPRSPAARGARSAATQRRRGRGRASATGSRRLWLAGLVTVVTVVGGVLYLRAGRGGSAEGGAIGVLKTADYHALAFSALDPDVAFFGHHNGVMRSEDGGRNWTPVGSGLGSGQVVTVAADAVADQTVYAGTGDGLFKSIDGSASWSRLPFPGENAAAVAVSPAQSGLLLAISVEDRQGMVYRSEDGGRTWRTDGG